VRLSENCFLPISRKELKYFSNILN
jgi:hypothetical protein